MSRGLRNCGLIWQMALKSLKTMQRTHKNYLDIIDICIYYDVLGANSGIHPKLWVQVKGSLNPPWKALKPIMAPWAIHRWIIQIQSLLVRKCLVCEGKKLILGFTVTVGHGVLRAMGAQVYLLLRSGEPLLDVDGQFPGGDPFPCLGHGARCGGCSPAVSGPATKRKTRGRKCRWRRPFPGNRRCVKPPSEGDLAHCA